MALRRYWLTFDVTFDSPYLMLLQGCGVTAYSLEDAHELIQTYILEDLPKPPIKSVTEDVDVSTLDPSHVLPNMGITLRRGIWFPKAE